MNAERFRVEKDFLGEVLVPKDAYYGAETVRALENFRISGLRFPHAFIRALAMVKACASLANMSLGLLDKKRGEAIYFAAIEVVEGRMDEHFPIDVIQTGSGTSINMNMNEVIANRAAEMLGGEKGDKSLIHPNDHVNMGQSSNDVVPTAIRVAAAEEINKKLIPSLEKMIRALELKSEEFRGVVKSGRTHLRDAVPVTLGQEFSGYAEMMRKGLSSIVRASEGLLELPIGGTATGTGLNTHPEFGKKVAEYLSEKIGLQFKITNNRFEAMGSQGAVLEVSASLRTVALNLLKICNDLRLLSSGPNTGLNEIEIPPVQPGSSIMPGKVNPVIIEAAMLASCLVIGNDTAIVEASRVGELELNLGNPLIAYLLLQSIEVLSNALDVLSEKALRGIRANIDKCRHYAERSTALITVAAPLIGYDKAAEILARAQREGITIKELLVNTGYLDRGTAEKIFDVEKMSGGGLIIPSSFRKEE
ncbi:MAG: class II fumarate hydratase [Nitrososphaerota archaeon]